MLITNHAYGKYQTKTSSATSFQLAQAFDKIERELTLLGATAVEDKLQEDVPKTIKAMIVAGIKVYVFLFLLLLKPRILYGICFTGSQTI